MDICDLSHHTNFFFSPFLRGPGFVLFTTGLVLFTTGFVLFTTGYMHLLLIASGL